MEIINLKALRDQMRADEGQEDELLALYGDAAERAVLQATRRTLQELREENYKRFGSHEFPHQLRVAILLLAAHWYRCREAVAGGVQLAVPYTYEYLVRPWVRLQGARRTDTPER